MDKLISDFLKNIEFVVVSAAIAAGLFVIAKVVEHFLPARRAATSTRRITIIAICSAIATVLHLLDFSLPFLAPGFYKLDFSELPVMLCGFYLGPSATIVCEGLKIILKLLISGTSTAFVGDFANFTVGCSLVLPATAIYHIRRTRGNAIWGLAIGTVALTVFGSAFNAIYLLPKFAALYGIPLEQIIAMGHTINPSITNVSTFALLAVAPLNLIKGISVSLLTFLLYKRLARPLFGKT